MANAQVYLLVVSGDPETTKCVEFIAHQDDDSGWVVLIMNNGVELEVLADGIALGNRLITWETILNILSRHDIPEA